ncbi:hypothetical protein SAMN05444158_0250 [Bradyrhizobium canariense]|uniref:Uncharacterized protein n=1 Tax=Bradyrhizobium canariense TaxID=255045 RepID=A0A1H1MK05_9BRAD|nr:hypothetical protein SAMN05444158_0250 [Bradyrhizobium canariense]
MTKRTGYVDAFQKVVDSVAGLITAVTSAAVAGHAIGFW